MKEVKNIILMMEIISICYASLLISLIIIFDSFLYSLNLYGFMLSRMEICNLICCSFPLLENYFILLTYNLQHTLNLHYIYISYSLYY